jgi:hypothetical protein
MSKSTPTIHPPGSSAGARVRVALVLATLATAICALALRPSAAAAGVVAPLPASDYQTRPACPAPTAGHASCLALELVPETSAARARTHPLGAARSGPIQAASPLDDTDGLRPKDLRDAYFPGEPAEAPASEPQTIVLVDAYNDLHAEADLEVYDREFGLEECEKANGCFEQLNEQGESENLPFPTSEAERKATLVVCEDPLEAKATREKACAKIFESEGWAVEISTDIEVAHAICQHNCHIVLVEAASTSYADLEAAEETAARLGRERTGTGATEISNSWGGSEPEPRSGRRSKAVDSPAFNHPGMVVTAAAGDDGYLNWTEAAQAAATGEEYYAGADYPASSPHVVAVGGTRLTLSAAGAWQSETVWNDDPRDGDENFGAGGSGCSQYFEAQPWQHEVPDWSEVGCEDRRAVADVSADGDPYSGVAIYDSVPDPHEVAGKTVNTPLYWWPIGGTSVASPIVASLFALAGGAHGVEYPAQTLYAHLETPLLHPVTAGGNGECDDLYSSGCSGSMDPLSPLDCGEGVLICNTAAHCAGHYYDGPAGVGTPNGIDVFKPEEHPPKDVGECKPPSEPSKEPEGTGSTNPGTGNEESTPSNGTPIETESTQSNPNNNTTNVEQSGGTSKQSEGGTSTDLANTPVRLSGLALTEAARAAVHRAQPKISRVAFAFNVSGPAAVRIVLWKLIRVHGHLRWVAQPGAFTTAATQGRDHRHLRGRRTLASGRYRLTLTPTHGGVNSLTFSIE